MLKTKKILVLPIFFIYTLILFNTNIFWLKLAINQEFINIYLILLWSVGQPHLMLQCHYQTEIL